MILQAYSIYDKKQGAYLRPFFMPNGDTATRIIASTILTHPEFSKFPEDYSLNHVGDFDEENGELRKADKIMSIIEIQLLYNTAKQRQQNENPNTNTIQ